jgi:hypothetical protein
MTDETPDIAALLEEKWAGILAPLKEKYPDLQSLFQVTNPAVQQIDYTIAAAVWLHNESNPSVARDDLTQAASAMLTLIFGHCKAHYERRPMKVMSEHDIERDRVMVKVSFRGCMIDCGEGIGPAEQHVAKETTP